MRKSVIYHAPWILVWLAGASSGLAQRQRATTVGIPATIDQLVLPGSELDVKPLADSRTPIVLRIAGAFPHGTAFRYDLVYYGLEPGSFDLRDFLQRRDGSSTEPLPPIPVEINPVLPPGQIEPNPLESKSSPYLGGYWATLILGGMVWLAGLLAILFVGRGSKGAGANGVEGSLSLADRLQPIVENAIAGKISRSQRAELERILLAFWRRRLNLDSMKAAEAIVVLREHEEAGQLLKQLEVWLHRPGAHNEVDVAGLLEPYRNLPADALDAVNTVL